MKKILRLGTRGSPLAIIQAEDVRKKILAAMPNLLLDSEIEIVPIRTSGDWRPEHKEKSFIELGGNKGLFTKEIEEALLSGYIDMAVHSMKDVATFLPPTLEIAALLERADPRDTFISRKYRSLDDMPAGASIGTSSLRRQSQILARRPDLRVVSLRGNVETRLKKLENNIADATLLAIAGLQRLGLANHATYILEADVMLPAAAQGGIGIEIRAGDEQMQKILSPLTHAPSKACIIAERAVLKVLDGNCQTPLAAFATINGTTLMIEALAANADGSNLVRLKHNGPVDKAETIGTALGEKLKGELPADFFSV
jgi:hydroxymethylbilane synthase